MGAELRKLRERAGMSGGEAAAFLGGERAQISHIESGRYGVSDQRVRRLAAHYSANDKHLVDALAAMAEERTKGWWEEYRGVLSPGFLDLAELEHWALSIRAIEMLYVPGIFQTEAYATSLLRGGIANLPTAELNARVEHRMRYCDARTMSRQLEYLCELSEWPSVTIRVIPFAAQITGSVHSMAYAGATIPALDTVQVDSAFDSGFLDAEAQLAKYRELIGSVDSISLSEAKSNDFIQRIAQEM
ncbi:helix-turn-helix transcriptional regulator [Streptomyces sp. RB110-2]|uniref:helix-turn-helix domain-containing protein n=1 Tax=Streptomyces sp. RB110-2 TaxID=2794863 RepID=UPI0027DA9811|nr:helix-turn-helix transcriptional regulator [Streptomyces sp. RB110-2]